MKADLRALAAELAGRRPEVEWKSGLIVQVFPKREHLLGAYVDCIDFGFRIELVAGGFFPNLGDAPYHVLPAVHDMSDHTYGAIHEGPAVGYRERRRSRGRPAARRPWAPLGSARCRAHGRRMAGGAPSPPAAGMAGGQASSQTLLRVVARHGDGPSRRGDPCRRGRPTSLSLTGFRSPPSARMTAEGAISPPQLSLSATAAASRPGRRTASSRRATARGPCCRVRSRGPRRAPACRCR